MSSLSHCQHDNNRFISRDGWRFLKCTVWDQCYYPDKYPLTRDGIDLWLLPPQIGVKRRGGGEGKKEGNRRSAVQSIEMDLEIMLGQSLC